MRSVLLALVFALALLVDLTNGYAQERVLTPVVLQAPSVNVHRLMPTVSGAASLSKKVWICASWLSDGTWLLRPCFPAKIPMPTFWG